jgi:hypothetical protein
MKEAIQVILDSSLALVAILIFLACIGTVFANFLSGGTHEDLDAYRKTKHAPKPKAKHPSRPKP